MSWCGGWGWEVEGDGLLWRVVGCEGLCGVVTGCDGVVEGCDRLTGRDGL